MSETKPDTNMSPILHQVSDDDDDVVLLDDNATEGEATDKGKNKWNTKTLRGATMESHTPTYVILCVNWPLFSFYTMH